VPDFRGLGFNKRQILDGKPLGMIAAGVAAGIRAGLARLGIF
jgi:hypothetical protein